MKHYSVEKYKESEAVQLYTVRLFGYEQNETDNFISRFYDENSKDFQTILSWIKKITETGALERYFRPEKMAIAIPTDKSNLRLYCYRVTDQILILGNGGKKSSQKVQDSPACFPHFELMNKVALDLKKSLNTKQTAYLGKELKGKLKF